MKMKNVSPNPKKYNLPDILTRREIEGELLVEAASLAASALGDIREGLWRGGLDPFGRWWGASAMGDHLEWVSWGFGFNILYIYIIYMKMQF